MGAAALGAVARVVMGAAALGAVSRVVMGAAAQEWGQPDIVGGTLENDRRVIGFVLESRACYL